MLPRTTVLAVLGSVLLIGVASAQVAQSPQAPAGNSQRPARDRAASRPAPVGSARLSGRVVAADTGRPLARVRVFATSIELPGGRATTTDDQGVFQITGLPAGRYNVNASRSGFLNMSYGQQRPRQPGTPLQLGDGQTIGNIDFSLPRGGVITGQIVDDTGEPLVGANVSVQRYEFTPGGRRLIPAGQGSTDDRGSYRVWGLMPGDYYVSASVRNFNMNAAGGFGLPEPVVITNGAGQAGTAVFSAAIASTAVEIAGPAVVANAPTAPDAAPERVALAPTYFPGVTQLSEAQPVAVAAGAEVMSVNFGVLVVRTALIRGQVTMADGKPPVRGNVMLMPEGAVGRGPGTTFGAGIQANGSFSIGYVPPGQYTLRARGGANESPQFAQQPITVGDGDTQNLSLILAPGATLSGTVSFQGSGALASPDPAQVRLLAQSADGADFGINNARVDRDGHFTMTGLAAGAYWLRAQGNLRGWALKSIAVDGGHEALDAPFEVHGNQPIAGISVVFTDRVSEINGTLTDRQQQPLSGYTVLAFPTDAALWRPQTRRIVTARPDQNGRFQLRGLPPGNYYVTPVDSIEPGEAYDPAFLEQHVASAARVSIREGEAKTQGFTLSSP